MMTIKEEDYKSPMSSSIVDSTSSINYNKLELNQRLEEMKKAIDSYRNCMM